MTPRRIFLIGLSGAGKSTVGKLLASRLGWEFADSDAAVESAAARSIPEIFREEGEGSFRAREAGALAELAGREAVVVATGGGAPTTEAARRAMGTGFVVWLAVSPETAARRLQENPETEMRPLLEGDTAGRLDALLAARLDYYQRADASIDVDALSPEQAAAEIEQLWHEWRTHPTPGHERFFTPENADRPGGHRLDVAAVVRTPRTSYPVVVQDGALDLLGSVCRDEGLSGRAFVVTDEQIGPLFATRALASLRDSGYACESFSIPTGEEHKTLTTLSSVFDWLLASRVERSDFAVCLGGGVVTDLAGFAAATVLRGIDFVHVPTSLLAMVDASIGGKTGVDHARGKNMIGAFAQPRAVIIDPALLATLPERHLRNGWAEVIKHGVILDEALCRELEAVAGDPRSMMSARLIGWSAAIKAGVVSEDEREAGRRTLLNYGHTIGHAIESITGYSSVLHGEAVAIGMRAAGLIAAGMGLLSADALERQQKLIRAAGLPESAPGVSVDAVLDATLSDKKVRGGEVRWVLLEGIGHAVVRSGVPVDAVRRAVETVLA
jgi:shikimate kinase/3-dehydroquinate synthase